MKTLHIIHITIATVIISSNLYAGGSKGKDAEEGEDQSSELSNVEEVSVDWEFVEQFETEVSEETNQKELSQTMGMIQEVEATAYVPSDHSDLVQNGDFIVFVNENMEVIQSGSALNWINTHLMTESEFIMRNGDHHFYLIPDAMMLP